MSSNARKMQLKQMAPWLRPRGKFKPNEREPIRTWTIVKGDKVAKRIYCSAGCDLYFYFVL